jgi:hypothetical protein
MDSSKVTEKSWWGIWSHTLEVEASDNNKISTVKEYGWLYRLFKGCWCNGLTFSPEIHSYIKIDQKNKFEKDDRWILQAIQGSRFPKAYAPINRQDSTVSNEINFNPEKIKEKLKCIFDNHEQKQLSIQDTGINQENRILNKINLNLLIYTLRYLTHEYIDEKNISKEIEEKFNNYLNNCKEIPFDNFINLVEEISKNLNDKKLTNFCQNLQKNKPIPEDWSDVFSELNNSWKTISSFPNEFSAKNILGPQKETFGDPLQLLINEKYYTEPKTDTQSKGRPLTRALAEQTPHRTSGEDLQMHVRLMVAPSGAFLRW